MGTGQYFPHQYNAHDDEKLKRVIMDHGLGGYAVFFLLLEYLGQKEDRVLTQEFYKVLAWTYRVDAEVVRSVVEDYGLFEISDNHFSSEGLNARMAVLDEIKAKRRAAGAMGGQKKAENRSKFIANARQDSSNASDLLEKSLANSYQTSSNALANSSNKNKGEENNNKEKSTTNKDESLLCCAKKESEQQFAQHNATQQFHFDERVCDSDFLAIVAKYMRKYACAPAEEACKLIDMMHPTWKGKFEDFSERKADATQLWQCSRDRKYKNEPRAILAECKMIDAFVKLIAEAEIYDVRVLNAYRGMEVLDGNKVVLCLSDMSALELLEGKYASQWFGAMRNLMHNGMRLEYKFFC